MGDSNALLAAMLKGSTGGDSIASALGDVLVRPTDDPMGITAGMLAGNMSNLTNPYASPMANGVTVLGASLLAGLLGGYAKRSAYEQNQAMLPLIGELPGADATRRAAILEQQPKLASLAAFYDTERAKNSIELEQARQKSQIDFTKSAADKLLGETGQMTVPGVGTVQLFDPNEVAKQKAIAQKLGEQAAQQQVAGGNPALASIAGIPQGLQDNAVKELENQAKAGKVGDFIESQFEKAKALPSASSLMPASTAKNEMEGIGVSLTTALQAALGREMNAKEQERLAKAIPDWNDTVQQIELKKQRFRELMNTITPGTPLVNQFTPAVAGPSATEAAQPKLTPTGRTSNGRPVYKDETGRLVVM